MSPTPPLPLQGRGCKFFRGGVLTIPPSSFLSDELLSKPKDEASKDDKLSTPGME